MGLVVLEMVDPSPVTGFHTRRYRPHRPWTELHPGSRPVKLVCFHRFHAQTYHEISRTRNGEKVAKSNSQTANPPSSDRTASAEHSSVPISDEGMTTGGPSTSSIYYITVAPHFRRDRDNSWTGYQLHTQECGGS